MDERLQVAKELSALTTKVDQCQHTIDKMSHALLGNGRVGLITRVDRLEGARRLWTKVFWFTLTGISGVVGVVISRILP